MSVVVLPAFRAFADAFDGAGPLLEAVMANYSWWKAKGGVSGFENLKP